MHWQLAADRFPPDTGPRSWRGRRVSLNTLRPAERHRAPVKKKSAIFLVQEKVAQGSNKSAEYRAYRRIAPKTLELVVISQPVAQTFCGRLLLQHLSNAAYFDPGSDWPKPIELNATLPTVTLPGLHDLYVRDNLLVLAGHGDGHILTVTVALLPAILTGRSDLCIAGVFGAGKTRSLAVFLVALSCELDDFLQSSTRRRTSRRKPLLIKSVISALQLWRKFGRLLGRIEEGKEEAYAPPEGLPQRKCPCVTPRSANGCPEYGLQLWMKVNNMATTTK